jgi:PAS domain S-box-containing protein
MENLPISSYAQEERPLQHDNEIHRLHTAIINSTQLAIISTDKNGIITSFNAAAEKLTAYTAADVVGKVTPEIFHSREEIIARTGELSRELGRALTPGIETFTANIKQKGDAERREWTLIRKDGTHIPVMLSICLVCDKDEHIGYSAIATEIGEEKKREERIEASKGHLTALVSSIDDIVFELDEHGRFIDMWVKSDDYLFLPRDQIYGKTLSEMLGQEFAKPFEEGLRQVLSTGETFVWEYQSPGAEDQRWFSAKTTLIFDKGIRTNRISVCIQDITSRKKMELSLRESEEKFRLLAENIAGVVYLMKRDAQKTIVYINDEITNLTGFGIDEFLEGRLHISQLVHEDDKLYVDNVREKAIKDRISFQAEYRVRHRDGSYRWVSETGTGVYNHHNVLYFEGCLTDITPRKAADEELRRMADENIRIFNNTLTLGAIATFDGYFQKLNPAWEKTLGWSREELQSKPFASFIHPDDLNKTEDILSVIYSGNTVATFENRYRHKDGSYRWLLWASSPDVSRRIIYAWAIDITSRKKSEEELLMSKRNLEVAAYELEEQNRQLDEFAHIISHNLRAPVNNIKALLSFINDSSNISDYQLIFEKIRNVTHNISETMNELLETIRIKKNFEIERVELRFKDTLDKVIQSLEGELIESGATVTYNFNNAPKIYYSKAYLESILQNLISNAIKYKSPDRIPEIHISTDLVKNGIELRVQDNGLGIDLNKFGHKLFGLHKTFHENTEARGVGLFLTKTQIETLGGVIHAESEVDKGTTFVIQF